MVTDHNIHITIPVVVHADHAAARKGIADPPLTTALCECTVLIRNKQPTRGILKLSHGLLQATIRQRVTKMAAELWRQIKAVNVK